MKYYKVEDVINTLADQWRFEQEMEYSDTAEDIEEWEKVARKLFADLPTIEVSEEVLKATKNFNAYTIADENAEMGMRTMIEPILEDSEDYVSREYALEVIDDCINYPTNGDKACAIKNAPSVVPSCQKNRQVERAEGKRSRCVWCDSPYRIEYNWIDREGNTASFADEDRHLVATGIANFCPNCGAKMKGADDEHTTRDCPSL